MTLASLATILLVVLKAAEFIDWSWWLVFSPVLAVAFFWIIAMAASGFLMKKYNAL